MLTGSIAAAAGRQSRPAASGLAANQKNTTINCARNTLAIIATGNSTA